MKYYWKCEECDETNVYPDVKYCETCGAPLTEIIEKKVLKEQKEEQWHQKRIRIDNTINEVAKNIDKRKKDREIRQKQKVLKKSIREKQKTKIKKYDLKLREKREKKFTIYYKKAYSVIGVAISIILIAMITLSARYYVVNNHKINFNERILHISENIKKEYMYHLGYTEETQGQRENVKETPQSEEGKKNNNEKKNSKNKLMNENETPDEMQYAVLHSIKKFHSQFDYLKENVHPSKNISEIIDYWKVKVKASDI